MLKYLVALLITSAACNAAQSIKVAVVAPFSGDYAAYGTLLLSGAMQAVEDINANDGIKGTPLEILPFDDQCDPEMAIKQASLIGKKHIQIVIGHVCSAATLAASSIYNRANILMLTPSATNNKITERKYNNIFRMIGTDSQQSSVATNFINKTLKSKRIAILHDQDLYSKDLADMVGEGLLRSGATPILYQGISRGTRNFTPIIKKLKVLEADAIYFAGLYPEVASLAKTLNILSLHIPIISADGIAINRFIPETGGTHVAGSILHTFPEDPTNFISSNRIITKMQKQHMETTGYALYSYAALQVIATAIDKTNTADGITLANWLHHNEVETILGKKSWDTNGDINQSKFNIYTLSDNNTLTTIAVTE